MQYWIMRHILIGPLARLVFRIHVTGAENIPKKGGVIIAANHVAMIDSFVLQYITRRVVKVIAKIEYYQGTGVRGALKRWFFSIGGTPVDRDDKSLAYLSQMIGEWKNILEQGGALGIHPEGTRSPDGRVYRGLNGVAYIALKTGVPIIPVSLRGTENAIADGSVWAVLWRLLHRPEIWVIVGESIDGSVTGAKAEALTRVLMQQIADQGDREYVHEYSPQKGATSK